MALERIYLKKNNYMKFIYLNCRRTRLNQKKDRIMGHGFKSCSSLNILLSAVDIHPNLQEYLHANFSSCLVTDE